ncbi:glycosyltransferase family 4 protein [Pseudarthrobacter sp. NIBRBAC000502772]|uniref:glycosyltransferase family 4 protein n=1 Tax=Pseudarthrobacter sp. NIBRBAC000502772 TaxID=2590775 RepID=UPI00143D68FA|nr:glycosyltransferase family 4 protein [Pseudarthrobacter sp. NIBRBAC000502772]
MASATGRYGGPFDTAVSQSRLTAGEAGIRTTLLAGCLPNDAPNIRADAFNISMPGVRMLVPRVGFTSCISWAMCRELVRQVRLADLVHVSYARELIPLLASILAIGLRKPLVIQPHGMLTARTSRLHKIVDLVARPVFRKATRTIALTVVERAHLQDWSGVRDLEQFSVIGNPLPFEPKHDSAGRADPMRRAMFIARLEPRKRVSDFLEAKRLANSWGWDELYEVVGPDQGDGEAVALAAAEVPGVIYRGAVPAAEVDSILDTAGVFVLTSKNEPWGNVLVAALLKGIPVVVTESAALAKEIGQNHLGIVVQDSKPEEVARAVHSILFEEWRSPEQKSAARHFAAQRFNQASIRDQLVSTYQSALSLKSRRT